MGKQTNMTVKGQITIPKDVRDALGLKPGEPVEISWDGGDHAVIRRPEVDREARLARIRAEIEATVKRFAHLATGQSTDDYMAEIREPLP